MKKNDKIFFITVMCVAVIITIIAMVVTGVITVPSGKKSEDNLGSITKTAEDYDYTQDYTQQYDEVIDPDTFVLINNAELIFDNLTLQATSDLDKELSKFLLLKGYSGDELVTLTIDESSIVNDRSYPYFEMRVDSDGYKIRAYYKLEEYKWVFKEK